MSRFRLRTCRKPMTGGFTLVEVLVATAVLCAGLMAVAQLAALTAASNLRARDVSLTTVLAAQKLNELVATDVAALLHSPPDAWMRSSGGTSELLDAAGRVTDGLTGQAIFVRRWSITPIPGDVTGGVAIQVSTGRLRRDPSSGAVADAFPFEVARAVGVRTGLAP